MGSRNTSFTTVGMITVSITPIRARVCASLLLGVVKYVHAPVWINRAMCVCVLPLSLPLLLMLWWSTLRSCNGRIVLSMAATRIIPTMMLITMCSCLCCRLPLFIIMVISRRIMIVYVIYDLWCVWCVRCVCCVCFV